MFIAGHIFICLLWGVAIAVAVTLLTTFITVGTAPSRSLTLTSWGVVTLMTVLISIQSVLAVGAFKVKGTVDDVLHSVNAIKDDDDEFTSTASPPADDGERLEAIKKKIPYIERLVDSEEITATTTTNRITSICEEAQSHLNGYILRRTLWSIAFAVFGAVGIRATLSRSFDRRVSRKEDYRDQRGSYR